MACTLIIAAAVTLSSCSGGDDGSVTKKVQTITVAPSAVSLKAGGTQQFTAAVAPDDAEDKTCTWSSDPAGWVDDDGLVTVPASAAAGTTATVTATADDGGGASGSATVTVLADDTPTVRVGVQTGTLTAGTAGTVTFPVTTTNFTWGRYTAEGDNLPAGVTVGGGGKVDIGADGKGTLTLAGDATTKEGTTSTLTLTLDGVTSDNTFTLKIGPAALPVITSHPQDVTTTEGGSATLSVTATGATGYQWQFSRNGGASYADLEGTPSTFWTDATEPTLTLLQALLSHGGLLFRCVVKGPDGGAVNSNPAKITVNPTPTLTVAGNQSGRMAPEYNQQVTYSVTTTGIADGNYRMELTRPSDLPNMINAALAVSGGAGTLTLTMAHTNPSVVGAFNLTGTAAGATSNVFKLLLQTAASEGWVIGGLTWAERNVSTRPGVFANFSEDYGGLYNWEESQTACPYGWRLPTVNELYALSGEDHYNITTSEWRTYFYVNGRMFRGSSGTNTVFLPAAGTIEYEGGPIVKQGEYGYYRASNEEEIVGDDGNIYLRGWYMAFSESTTDLIYNSTPHERRMSVRCVKD
jgi:uncharacterized protein (TIGR02145 family)